MSTVRIDPKRWEALKNLEVNLTAQKNQIVKKSEIINYLIDEAISKLQYDDHLDGFKIDQDTNN